MRLKVPDLNPKLAQQAVEFVQKLRKADMRKSPSISETLDWANALVALNASNLDKETLEDTLSVLLKHEADLQKAKRQLYHSPTAAAEDRSRMSLEDFLEIKLSSLRGRCFAEDHQYDRRLLTWTRQVQVSSGYALLAMTEV